MAVFNASWPIAQGDEVTAEHFEDIRRFIFMLERPFSHSKDASGDFNYTADFGDLDNPYDSSTWASLMQNNPTDTEDCGTTVAYTENAIGHTVTDIFVLRHSGTLHSTLETNPPLDSSTGELNTTYWLLGEDRNQYEDSDKHAGRDDLGGTPPTFRKRYWGCKVNMSPQPGGNNEFDYLAENHKWQPEQVGKDKQNKRICTDYATPATRTTSANPAPLEVAKSHLTNSLSMLWLRDENPAPAVQDWNNTEMTRSRPQDAPEADYGVSPGQQRNLNTKMCSSYQDRVQHILCEAGGNYYFEVDNAWEHMFNLYGITEITQAAPPYDPENEPTHPLWSEAQHWYFQCNGIGFEKAIKEISSYDWYWDDTTPFRPGWIRTAREDFINSGGSEADAATKYPWPEGCWRRTWQYSFKGLDWQNLMDNDLCSPTTPSSGSNSYLDKVCVSPDTYNAMPSSTEKTDYYQSLGSGSDCYDPSISLTQQEKDDLTARHLPEQTRDTTSQYEIMAGMLNDMWNALNKFCKVKASWPYSVTVKRRSWWPTLAERESCDCSGVTTTECTANKIPNVWDNAAIVDTTESTGYHWYGYLHGEIRSESGSPYNTSAPGQITKRTFGVELTYLDGLTPYVFETNSLEFRLAYKDRTTCTETQSPYVKNDVCKFNFENTGIGSSCSGTATEHFHEKVHLKTPSAGHTVEYWAEFKTEWPVAWMGGLTISYTGEHADWSFGSDINLKQSFGVGAVVVVDWASYPPALFASTGKNFETAE